MLTLYINPDCPFCQRVLQVAENLNVTLDVKDITEDEAALAELIEKGGKDQVPYFIDSDKDVTLYESGDIIEYLREHCAPAVESSSENNRPRIHVGGSTCESCEG